MGGRGAPRRGEYRRGEVCAVGGVALIIDIQDAVENCG
jgi:hypothetical protein